MYNQNMKWTQQQEKAITERGSSLLVSAAAGSGKTAVLVERIRRLVVDEGIGLDRMLIVTFTRAAAGEMKEKIYKSLSKALAEAGKDPGRRTMLRTQLSSIGRADICTFDQFALEVVHRYYHAAGLAPGIAVCDDGRGAILRREAMDELFEELFAAEDPDFIDFLSRYCSSRSNDAARSMIFAFYDFLQSLPDPDQWMDSLCSEDFSPAPFVDFAAGQVTMLLRLALSYVGMAAELLVECPKLRAKLLTSRQTVKAVLRMVENDPEKGLNSFDLIKWERMVASGGEKEVYETVKAGVGKCLDKAKDICKKDCKPYIGCSGAAIEEERQLLLPQIRTLCKLTRSFSARYLEKKLKKNTLDFSDIEHYALKILNNEEIASEYREKFACIFVDEYQDSNLVQDSLIRRIARPDNCFMVGDVKQSIYKFRQAEPELFLEKYYAFRSGQPVCGLDGRIIDLNRNFRSGTAVIGLVNRIFEKLMTPASTGIEYNEDAALVHGRAAIEGAADQIGLWLADTSPAEGKEPEDAEVAELRSAELEALQAVSIIKKYHHSAVIKDEANPDGRLLEYRDMVILMRGVKSRAEVFYKYLSNAGIPVVLERGEGYFDTVEISVFLNLLRLIDNGHQDIPLLSVLHFPSFGFSASELAEIRGFSNSKGLLKVPYNEAFRFFTENSPESPLRCKCADFIQRLERWRFLALHTPLGDFLWDLLCSTGIGDFTSAIPGGTQRYANLRALVTKAEEYENRSAGGLHGFISYVEMITAKGGKVDIGQAKILTEGSDAVRIMTIHKSKGLEFPFVLLAGVGSRLGGSRDGLALNFHKDYGIGMPLVRRELGLRYDPLIHRIISAKKKADELAEEIRVLYVAMTRPKDIMILSAAVKDPRELINNCAFAPGDVWSPSDFLGMLLPLIKREEICISSRTQLAQMLSRVNIDRAKLEDQLKNGFEISEETAFTDEELKERISFTVPEPPEGGEHRKYSVSELAEMARNGLKSGRPYLASEEEEVPEAKLPDPEKDYALPAFMGAREALTSTEKGTAYHTVMEHIPFTEEGKSLEEIADFIASLRERNILTASEAAVVRPARIAAFFMSVIGQRAIKAQVLKKEAPFTFRTDHLGTEVLIQGTIDCCFIEDGKWILVDYKSNYVDRNRRQASLAHLKENYIPQLDLYRRALEAITGIPVKEAVLYLFGIDEELPLY